MQKKLNDHPNIPNKSFADSINRFNNLKSLVEKNIKNLGNQVEAHESYRDTYNLALDWIRKVKLDLQQCGDSHGEREEALRKQEQLKDLIDSFPDGDTLIRNVMRYSAGVMDTTGEEGKDIIKQEDQQLKYDWDQVRNQARQKSMQTLLE